jgi:hypothetical protein
MGKHWRFGMSGFSLNDIEQLPDPKKEQDAVMLLMLLDSPGPVSQGQRILFTFTQGNNWSKAKLDKAVSYVVSEGWAVKEGGMLQITESGRTKIGK